MARLLFSFTPKRESPRRCGFGSPWGGFFASSFPYCRADPCNYRWMNEFRSFSPRFSDCASGTSSSICLFSLAVPCPAFSAASSRFYVWFFQPTARVNFVASSWSSTTPSLSPSAFLCSHNPFPENPTEDSYEIARGAFPRCLPDAGWLAFSFLLVPPLLSPFPRFFCLARGLSFFGSTILAAHDDWSL